MWKDGNGKNNQSQKAEGTKTASEWKDDNDAKDRPEMIKVDGYKQKKVGTNIANKDRPEKGKVWLEIRIQRFSGI
ncbi:hypothetical protein [Bacillus mycoides]|uniref:hypothetical protein n=1 Tax=Bacillus mycoides TaxID=1405 RepID=UPI001C038C6F|nr:hypothetical protein [Bacillus mycoides]QWJ00427.1 hypothetical protein J5V93_25315 [Bacillus mycoides]